MSHINAAAHLIKLKVRATGDWITITVPGALSTEADPMSTGYQGRLSRAGLDRENWEREAVRSVSELSLNSNNFPCSHLKSSGEWEQGAGGGGGGAACWGRDGQQRE